MYGLLKGREIFRIFTKIKQKDCWHIMNPLQKRKNQLQKVLVKFEDLQKFLLL